MRLPLLGLVLVCIGILAVGLPPATDAKVVHNELEEGQGLQFLSKFCFSKGSGNVFFKSWVRSGDVADVVVLAFDDEPSSWPSVRDLSCQEQRNRAKWIWPVGDSQLEQQTIINHIMPRYWYIALSRCSPGKYDVEYEVEFLQGGGYWENQFSYDEWGLMALYLSLFLLYIIMFAVQVRVVIHKLRQGELNHLHRLFTLVLIVYTVSFLSFFIHNAVYGDDGIGAPGLAGFGEILEICGEMVFLGIILGMARGWLVITTELRGKKTLIVLFCMFLLSYVAFFIWENVGLDVEDEDNVYQSVPGIINQCVRFIIWCFFAFQVGSTIYRKGSGVEYFYQEGAVESKWEPEQRKVLFYSVFGVVMSIWFLALPFFVLVSLGVSPYNRVKLITFVYYIINMLVHMLLLTWFFFKSHGPVEGGDSVLGHIGRHAVDGNDSAFDGLPPASSSRRSSSVASNPFASFSTFSTPEAGPSEYRGKGIELQTRSSRGEEELAAAQEEAEEPDDNSSAYEKL